MAGSPRRRPLEKMGADPERVTAADTEAPQYTDNFSIDMEAVTAFAEQIRPQWRKRIWRRWRTWRRIR